MVVVLTMIEIPVPVSNIEIVALAMGITFGRNIGKKLDQGIKESDWFKRQWGVVQWFIGKALDCTHHWWIGALIWLYSDAVSALIHVDPVFIMFFGVGLFVDDIRDFNHVISRYKQESEPDS